MHTRLRQIREYFKLSQQQMADALNISKNGYWYYETGKRELKSEEIFSLIKLYNININWLITGEGEMFLEKEIKPIHLPNRSLEVEAMTLNEGKNLYLIQKFNGYSDEKMAEIFSTTVEEYLSLTNGTKKMQLKHYDAVKSNFDVDIDDLRYDENGLFRKLEEKLNKQKQTFDSMSAQDREEFLKFLQSKK